MKQNLNKDELSAIQFHLNYHIKMPEKTIELLNDRLESWEIRTDILPKYQDIELLQNIVAKVRDMRFIKMKQNFNKDELLAIEFCLNHHIKMLEKRIELLTLELESRGTRTDILPKCQDIELLQSIVTKVRDIRFTNL